MKIFCALGPGNVVADALRDGGIVAGVTGYSFSQQLRRLLVAHGITGVLVTSNPDAGRVEQGGLTFQNLPRRGEGATGPADPRGAGDVSVDGAEHAGICTTRPSAGLVDALDRLFEGER